MIDGCDGCEEDFKRALMYEEEGLHFATMSYYGKLYSIDEDDDHLYLLMVDDNGKLVIN